MSKRQRQRRAKGLRHRRGARTAVGTTVAVGAVLAGPAVAQAAPIQVTSTADTDTAGTLRHAITEANGTVGYDAITFDLGPGSHTIHLTSPLPTVTQELFIDGPGLNALTIDGSFGDGGILSAQSTTLTISDVDFHGGSRPTGIGGGAITAIDSTLEIDHATLTGNSASDGGAIYAARSYVDVILTTFSGNSAMSFGGAIYGQHDANALIVQDSHLTGNSARTGGAVASYYQPLDIRHSTISGNHATANGGGLDAEYAGGKMRNSTVSGNTATLAGGGLLLNATGPHDDYAFTIQDSTISGNTAGAFGGGGIFSLGGPYYGDVPNTQQLQLQDATVAANHSTGPGGGVNVTGPGGPPSATSTVESSILGCNSTEATSGADLSIGGGQNRLDTQFTLIQSAPAAAFTDTVADSDLLGQDPGLAALGGAGTPTRALAANSPAIDQGKAVFPQDQRGLNRFDQPAIPNSAATGADGSDMGAFELQNGETTPSAAPCDSHVGHAHPAVTSPIVRQTPPTPSAPGSASGNVDVGGFKGTPNGVRLRIVCTVGDCDGRALLNAIARVNGKKVLGLKKLRRKRVRVGSKRYSLHAGQTKTMTVHLNARGRKLHRKFRRMPVHLVVSQKQANGKSAVIMRKKVKLKAKHKPR